MKGIREVAGATKKFCKKDGYGYIVQITFDPETKEIWLIPQQKKSGQMNLNRQESTFHIQAIL